MLNSQIGVHWREVAKQQIHSLNNEGKSQSCLQNIGDLDNDCVIKGNRDLQNWPMMMLNHNRIDIHDLLNDIIQIMDKKTKKVNTLRFCGITNTGKTMLANNNNS